MCMDMLIIHVSYRTMHIIASYTDYQKAGVSGVGTRYCVGEDTVAESETYDFILVYYYSSARSFLLRL